MLQENRIIRPDAKQQKIAADKKVFATFSNVDFQRTRFWTFAASVAIGIPRRLGPDAAPLELTYDKRVSRKVCGGYRMLWTLWYKESEVPPPPEWADWPVSMIDPLMTRIGATVIWPRQLPYLLNVVEKRRMLLSELEQTARDDGIRRWYSKTDMLLEWEYDHIVRMLKFLDTKRPTS